MEATRRSDTKAGLAKQLKSINTLCEQCGNATFADDILNIT